MAPVIEVRNVSKQYILGGRAGANTSFREAITHALLKPFQALRGSSANGQTPAEDNLFWALKDVSLDVEAGDTFAIIGSNGAGKSTLLKILSRITDPTEGMVKVRGRLASLLEVGTGFHPELTGRENIYLNGSILGMTKAEIEARFNEITAFAGIGRFLDTPVKRYSSGMFVRLAFAIAAHLDPEILIVDEVLAVGDVAFQKKCLGKMAEACAQARTVIFVSHNLAVVEALCNKAIVLNQGRVAFTGSAKDASEFYMHTLATESAAPSSHIFDLHTATGRPVKYQPQIKGLELYTEGGKPFLGELRPGGSLRAVIHFTLEEPCFSFDCTVAIDQPSGQRVCTAHTAYEPDRGHAEKVGEQVFVCDIESIPLVPGDYKLSVGLDVGGREVDWVDDVARLRVVVSDYYGTGVVPNRGVFLLKNRWALSEEKSAVFREP